MFLRILQLESEVRDLNQALRERRSKPDASGMLELTLPAGVIYHSEAGKIEFANPAFLLIAGRRQRHVLGGNISSIIAKNDLTNFFEHLRQCKQRARTAYIEVNMQKPAGNVVPVQFVTSHLKSKIQSAAGFQSIIIEVTEQRTARAAAEQAQLRYFTMLETVEGIVWEAEGHNLDITFVSPFADKVFGYPSGAWYVPEFWENHIHVDDRDRVMSELAMALRDHEKLTVDYRVIAADRRTIWIHDQIAVRMIHGKPRLLGVAVDITEVKKIEAELKHYQSLLEQRVSERTDELRRSMSDLETFSYSLSHDLRAPLRAIRGYSEILQARLGQRLNANEADLFDRIQSSARRMDNLIQDVLKYSSLVRGTVPLSPVDLDNLVREVIHDYPALQPPYAEIAVTQPLGRVVGNEAYLSQCVSNLLCNAVKFVKPGTTPRVSIYATPRGGELDLCFQDNGVGISKADQNRIFGMFTRLQNSAEYEGTGIGLAVVKKATERMRGLVGVESEPGHGSRFWIRLPSAA